MIVLGAPTDRQVVQRVIARLRSERSRLLTAVNGLDRAIDALNDLLDDI